MRSVETNNIVDSKYTALQDKELQFECSRQTEIGEKERERERGIQGKILIFVNALQVESRGSSIRRTEPTRLS